MAEKRKLQSEIEKTLKRVDDGIEDFDNLLLKAEDIQTQNQKEKMEGELKRDIKKLQRLRDQIKVWLTLPEVKDKPPLEEARKKIEKEMEKFKACEKLFKIKAFSKEGLAQQAKLGPQEVEREKHRKWIREALDRLNTEIDSHEAEIEKYKTSKKGRIKSQDAESITQLEGWAVRHKWHVAKLEKILRRLENDDVDIGLLDDISEMVEFYLESFQDPEYFHDDEMYATLGLEDTPEESFGMNRESDSVDGGEESGVELQHTLTSLASGESVGSKSKKSSLTSAPIVQTVSKRMKQESTEESVSVTSTSIGTTQTKVQLQPRPTWSPAVSYAAAIKSTLSVTQAEPQQQQQLVQAHSQSQTQPEGEPTRQDSDWRAQLSIARTDEVSNASVQSTPLEQPSPIESLQHATQLPTVGAELPIETTTDMDLLLKIVGVAHQNLPELKHRRHFRYYQPKTIWNNPPSSFPKYPLKDFATSQFFSKLDLDTLFFTFYHQQGTYQQYLAARELKRQNWRYHKKYLTWFQPQGGPKIVTDKLHRGAWVYFDSDAGWCSRLKHDFTFEFSFLEDELPVPPPHTNDSNNHTMQQVSQATSNGHIMLQSNSTQQ